jgi:hypothetical protein
VGCLNAENTVAMGGCLPGRNEMLLVIQPKEIGDEVKVMVITSDGIRLPRVPKLCKDK